MWLRLGKCSPPSHQDEEEAVAKSVSETLDAGQAARVIDCSPVAVYHVLRSHGVRPIKRDRNDRNAEWVRKAVESVFPPKVVVKK
jgi:hypothetical protein